MPGTPTPSAADGQLGDHRGRHAAAAILDLQRHTAPFHAETNPGHRAPGVAVDVDQCLLDDAEQRRFNLPRQAVE